MGKTMQDKEHMIQENFSLHKSSKRAAITRSDPGSEIENGALFIFNMFVLSVKSERQTHQARLLPMAWFISRLFLLTLHPIRSTLWMRFQAGRSGRTGKE